MKLPEKMSGNVTFMLANVTRQTQRHLESELNRFGLTRSQWLFLSHLYFVEGCNQQELADILDIGKVALGKVAIRLEGKGWVKRVESSVDARSIKLQLCDTSRPLVAILVDLLFEETNRSLTGFTPQETSQLYSYIERMSMNVETQPNTQEWLVIKGALAKKVEKLKR